MTSVDLDVDTHATFVPVPMKDQTGRDHLVVILVYTFVVDAHGVVEIIEGDPPRLVDEYNGPDAAKASIRKPSQLFDFKPGTDVIFVGHAHPPRSGKVDHVDVTLQVGSLAKTVRAHGLRVWQWGLFGGLAPGPALPIHEPIPLIYELAWGGLDLSRPESPVGDTRNTVGRGVTRRPRELVDQAAAQIEDPARPLGSGKNIPAGLGAIHRHWEPRAQYAGTYDEVWKQTKMPLLPDDFDARFHVAVPHDQWAPTPLRGDEPIEIRGATPEGLWRFQLPRFIPGFSSFVGRQRTDHRTHLDSMLIDADARRVELTWRAAIPLPRKHELLERVSVVEKDRL